MNGPSQLMQRMSSEAFDAYLLGRKEEQLQHWLERDASILGDGFCARAAGNIAGEYMRAALELDDAIDLRLRDAEERLGFHR